MKYVSILLLLLLLIGKIFPDTFTTLEEINTYGGKTIEAIIDEKDVEQRRYSKAIIFYDDNNNRVKIAITPSPSIINERGITQQIDYYNSSKIIEKFEMLFSDSHTQIHDYNRIVEEVNENDVVTRTTWYIDNTIIDTIGYPREMNKFNFYNIKFLENEFLEFYEPNPDPAKDTISISYKYVSIRSVIKFDTEFLDLDDTDIYIIKTLLNRLNAPDSIDIYKKKVRVFHNKNFYWLYVQTQLEEHIKGQDATVSYYPIMWNGKLYLLCVGFYNINSN